MEGVSGGEGGGMGVRSGHTGNMNKSCITRVTWGEMARTTKRFET